MIQISDREGWGCTILFYGGILAGAIWWLGWQTVLALFLLLLIVASPLLFALLEREEELCIRLIALNYGVTLTIVLFLFVSEIIHFPHRYNLLEWTIGLGFMVGVTNVILTWLWFQKLRVISTRSIRRLENQARRSTIGVGLTITFIVVLAILGSCTLRPRMQRLHYWEKESPQRIHWIYLRSAEAFPEKHLLSLTFETYGEGRPTPSTTLYMKPGAGEEEEWLELTPCSVWAEEQAGTCQFNVSLSPSYFTRNPDDWEWKVWFYSYVWAGADYTYTTEFRKSAGRGEIYEVTGYNYNFFTDEAKGVVVYRGNQVIKEQ